MASANNHDPNQDTNFNDAESGKAIDENDVEKTVLPTGSEPANAHTNVGGISNGDRLFARLDGQTIVDEHADGTNETNPWESRLAWSLDLTEDIGIIYRFPFEFPGPGWDFDSLSKDMKFAIDIQDAVKVRESFGVGKKYADETSLAKLLIEKLCIKDEEEQKLNSQDEKKDVL